MSARVRRSAPLAAPAVSPAAPAACAPPPPPPPPRSRAVAPAATEAARPLDAEFAAVLAWPAVWLAELPAAWSLLCEHASGRRWVVTTSQHNYTRRRSHGLAVMHGDEWLALCVAAAQGRATLAVGQWLVPTMPPPPPRVAPDWTVPPQALARLLGPAEAQLGQPGQLGQRVADVLAHFRARAIALDPPTEATCDELL